MENTFNTVEYFEAYLDKTLSAEKRNEFEAALSKDDGLNQAFQFYQQILKGLTKIDQVELENSIIQISKKLTSEGFFFNEEDIQDYLSGKMPKATIVLFEARMKTDINFAEQVNFEKNLLQGLTKVDESDLKANIQNIQSKLEQESFFETADSVKEKETTKVISIFTRYRAIAATLLLTIVAGLFWFFPAKPNSEQLYANYYELETEELTPLLERLEIVGLIPTEQERKNSLSKALQSYKVKNFKSTSFSLQDHLKTYPNDEAAQFYLGVNYMELNKFNAAIEAFQKISSTESEWYDDGQWYLALSYIKIGAFEDAKFVIRKISSIEKSKYQKSAEKILNEDFFTKN